MGKRSIKPQAIGQALEAVIDARTGPLDADSLSRSYGIPKDEVIRVLKQKGKYHG